MTRRYDMSVREAAATRTRENILDAALRLFRDAWYEDVTLLDVAREAGVSQQTVVNHFGTKANLYLTGIWLSGREPIGHRPLLAFGVLSMLVGVQFFAVGLLSELVLSYQARNTDDVSIRRRLD